jgi:integrase
MPVYKDEKRGTWYTKFNYTDWNGSIKQKLKRGFLKQKDAKEFERNFLEKSQASPDMSFQNLYDLYMEDCKSRLKPTTYKNKEYVVGLKVLAFFKNMQLNKIEPATVRKWQNELISSDENYSQTYLKTINNQLSAIFNFSMKYYKLSSNPARICGSMGKKNADSMEFWTKEEFYKFLPEISDKPLSKAAFSVLFWTGIRSGEILALTLNDFDFEERILNINKNYARHEGEDLILQPKTPKSKRTITLPKFLCDMVNEYVDHLYDYEPDERLFQVTKHYLNHERKRGCKKSGVKKIRIHDLRHSHASLLIEEGFSPLLISERLGHENIETTLQTYSHLYPNKHGQVADRLDKINDDTDNTDNTDNSE